MAERPKITRASILKSYRIFKFIKPYKWHFAIGMICLVISSSMFMIFPAAAGEMANAAIGKGKWNIPVKQFGLVFLVILIVQGILSYFRTTFFALVSEKGIADVRKALYEKLITQDLAFFESHRVGELTSRLTADVEQLQSAFSITLAELIRQIVVLISGIIILAWMTPRLALIMLLTFPFIVIASILFGRFIRGLSRKRQDSLAETNIIVEESFQSFQTVKAFTNERFEVNRFSQSISKMVEISLNYAKMRGLFFIFIITVLFGGLFFILWRGAMMVEDGQMAVGDLFSFIIYTGIIGGAIAGLGNLYTALAGSLGATERIQDILDRDQEVILSQDLKEQDMQFKGDVFYNTVSFSYPARPEMQVLEEINFHILNGKRIALVGASGAGKSTIVQLLMRFYKPSVGTIEVDGKNIDEYNLTSYRKNIAIVPQEILLFGGTIRENILYGKPNATDEELMEASRKSNSIEFIQSFPDQFDTIVGERGVKLSGGQRQRIAIARAILRNPSILILDEATSSLDAESERLVQDALDTLMKDRTSIIIAHRLSTVKNADCIYVLKKGRIAEYGTHDVLIHKEDGIYKSLVELQMDLNES
ncbi:MAG: ATP-binding cassette domain-containing protein [Saprospiraceae bacterium]|nr:ATP-binding cassette domain-containing protein [Saprospiraceae bacterium]